MLHLDSLGGISHYGSTLEKRKERKKKRKTLLFFHSFSFFLSNSLYGCFQEELRNEMAQ
jgi:hypothetical protein